MITIKDIFDFVHSLGRWQDECCYETKVGFVHDTMIIANFNTYGTKDEQERANDAVLLDKGKNGKYRLCSVSIMGIDKNTFKNNPFYLEESYYKEFIIENNL